MYKQNTTAHSDVGSTASSSPTLAGEITPIPNLPPTSSLNGGPGPSPLSGSPDAPANLIQLDSPPPPPMPGENINGLMDTLNIN